MINRFFESFFMKGLTALGIIIVRHACRILGRVAFLATYTYASTAPENHPEQGLSFKKKIGTGGCF